MTNFVFPKNRLAKLLRAAGGKPVVEALEDASANLKTIEPEAQAELQVMLREVEARYAALGETYDDEKLDDLYFIANRVIGVAGVCGRQAVDVALVSLCQLLDYLKTAERWDNASVGVHVQALRLLLGADPNDQQVAAILDGLKRVSALYAAPAKAESEA
jgi:hypothetical protein